MELLFNILAMALMWVAVDYGRNPKIKFGSKNWWVILFFTLVSAMFLNYKG